MFPFSLSYLLSFIACELSFKSETDTDIGIISGDEFTSPVKSYGSNIPTQLTDLAKMNDTIIGNDGKNLNNYEVEEPKFKMYENLAEFNQNLPETVTLLTSDNGSCVYLVGTAHFSEKSQDDVSLVIRNVKPDIVLVELCPSRVHILRHDEKTLLEEAKDINVTKIRNIIKSNGLINGIFYILLLNMSAKITKEIGMPPGGEFRRLVVM